MKTPDFSKYLNSESKFCQNFEIVFDELNRQREYMIQNGYYNEKINENKVDYSFEEINITENKAYVTITIKGDIEECYPWFICLGENIITLQKQDENWLISQIENDDSQFIALDNDEFHSISNDELYKKNG